MGHAGGEGQSGVTADAASSPASAASAALSPTSAARENAAATDTGRNGLLEEREPEADACEPADDAIEQLMLGCKYSSLRRAQRLSFAVGAVMDGVSGSEGRQVLPLRNVLAVMSLCNAR